MGDTNPFHILFAIAAFTFISIVIFLVFAPAFNISIPAAPTWPGFASDLDWTVTLTNWAGIGSFFVSIGGLFVFVGSYFYYIISMTGLMFSLLTAGFIPAPIATAATVLIGIGVFGAILVYLRGNEGGK
jgi:hypothetical protein